MPFRFVHTADIHLDSPLRSLALRDRGLAAQLKRLDGAGPGRSSSAATATRR